MGNQKQKWTAGEEQALLAGIAKHGPGKWKNILKDPEFAHFLTQRSNIDLKVQNCYKLKKDTSTGTKTPIPKQKAIQQRLAARTGLPNAMGDCGRCC